MYADLRAAEGAPLQAVFGPFEMTALWVILAISLLALAFAYKLVREVLGAPQGTVKMIEIAGAIQEGARAYMARQMRTVSWFILVLGVVLFFALPVAADAAHAEVVLRAGRSLAFVLGAAFSALTGYAGMWLAVRANVRTAAAAREHGARRAMRVAFRAGGVAGMFTVGLGLLGATVILLIYQQDATAVLVGFGFGGALLAMFMRVGGGIFTKAADVGADLVGKVEQGIPEDDPRNAATIADNVGDNVGDCAGMAADLFESYEVTLVAALILGAAAWSGSAAGAIAGVMFPLLVRAVGVLTSMVGIVAVNPRSDDEHGMRAINRGFFLSAGLSAAAVLALSGWYMQDLRPAVAVILGLVLASVIQVLTQYFTDARYRPVKEVAESTRTGPATTILSGFSLGLESTVWAILTIALVILSAFAMGDGAAEALYFISLTGMGMLTTVGVIVSMDTFGPVADNAQGIAEMSGEFEGEAARSLGRLDATGNSTKAITKGIAIATAVIAATSLFGSFEEALRAAGMQFEGIRVDQPDVLVGLLIGGAVGFLFSSLLIRAVSRAAGEVVVEVRRQFHDEPGIMTYEVRPDYARVVDLCTKRSLHELLTPGLLAVLTPVAVGFALGAEALGAFLAGSILTGQLLAVMLSNAGGAWDNSKKYIEDGHLGGKGSTQHLAAVIGDTVGDPFKDTAGPSLNPLIKVMNLVAVLLAPLIVSVQGDGVVRAVVTVAVLLALGAAISRSTRQPAVDLLRPAGPARRPVLPDAPSAPTAGGAGTDDAPADAGAAGAIAAGAAASGDPHRGEKARRR
ncbi:sodium-translocating pyrophosphatase [Georgenia muralis]